MYCRQSCRVNADVGISVVLQRDVDEYADVSADVPQYVDVDSDGK